MNGFLISCLCLISGGFSQRIIDRIGGGVLDKGIGGLDPLDRRGSVVGGFDGRGRFIGGLDGLGGLDGRGISLGGLSGGTALGGLSTSRVSGGLCYRRGERPAYDRYGRVEWCSYRYNFCNAPGAVCRLSGWGLRRSGACCHRTGGPGIGYCRNGAMGIGSCSRYRPRDCLRYGSGYQCETNGRRYGRCCRRYGHPQQRDEHCRSGRAAAGYCRARSTCPHGGIHYRCEFNQVGSRVASYAYSRRRGLCCETGGHPRPNPRI